MSTFILRLRAPASGEVRGVVEHVSDGKAAVVTNMAELEAFLIQRRPVAPGDNHTQGAQRMTSTTFRRLAAATLATGLLGAATAGPALAATAKVKPKLGTYKGREANGQKITLVVGPCSNTGKASCLYTPDRGGSAGDIEVFCKGLNGAGDGIDDYSIFGPDVLPASGKIKSKSTFTNFGNKETQTYSFTVTAKGTITGTERLTASFPDGARCDSGVVKLSAKR